MAVKVKTSVFLKGGEEIKPVTNIHVHQRYDWHSSFEFHVKIDEKVEILLQKAQKYIGKEVDIKIDEVKSGKGLLFKGIITDLSFANTQGGTNELVFRGYDPSITLDDGPMVRSFTEKDLSQIVNSVINPVQQYFSKKKISPNLSDTLPYIVQYEESNYHFLHRLALKYGEWFYYNGEQLVFGKSDTGDTVELDYGTNLMSLDFSLQVKPASFEFQSYNYEKNDTWNVKANEAESGGLDGNKYGDVVLKESKKLFGENPLTVFPDVKDKGFLKKLASGTRGALENQMVFFSGVSDLPSVVLGGKIKVGGRKQGVKTKEKPEYGEYLITSVVHSAGYGGYQNHFEAIPANTKVPPFNKNIRMPISDPQIAVVKKNDDPDKMGRIQVKFGWQNGTPEVSPWIRVSTPYAGKDRGLYVLPETGDEVWVNFDFNDPEKPYMAGSFYHGKIKPSAFFDKDNNLKIFKTKAGNQITINDKSGKEEIKIFNKKDKNFISLSLDGKAQISVQTEGKLYMKAKDIVMESQTLKINASNKIETDTQTMTSNASKELTMTTQQMTLDGGTKLDMKGMNSKLEATKADIKAAANLNLDGGAMSVLKGALVKIN